MINYCKKISTVLISLLMVFAIAGCEKEVILDLADKTGAYIIVEANITDDGTRQWVRLSYSSSYYDTGRGLPVRGARVSINNGVNDFLFIENLTDSLGGYYFSDRISNNLRERDLELNIIHNEQNYFARSSWRPLPVIDSVTMRINAFSQLGFRPDTLYDIVIHFEELTTPEDHYLFNLYVNDTLLTVRPRDKGLVSDINLTDYVSFAVQNINRNRLIQGDAITLEMRSISKENFEFYNVFFFQTDLSGNPFAGAPPANIPTNLSQGARGFFQVSAVKRKTIIYDPPSK